MEHVPSLRLLAIDYCRSVYNRYFYLLHCIYLSRKQTNKPIRQKAISPIWRDRTNLRTRHDNNVGIIWPKFETTMNRMLRALMDKVVVQSLNCVWLSVIPQTATGQASQSFAISQSLLKLMSIELVMPSNHLLSSFAYFSSCPQTFPAAGPFAVNWLLASGDQSIATFSKVLDKLDSMKRQRSNVSRKWKS